MAPGVSLLRHLQLEVDEHGEGYWVKFDSFIELLKSKHAQRDSIVAIKTSNVHKELNGHRNGLKVISGEEYVSYHSVVKYMFHHCDQLIFCKRVCDQIIHCSLGSSDTVSNIFEIYKAVSHKQLHNKHIETLLEKDISDLENDIPTLYKHYKINFKKDEWTRIVEFEFHFNQRYETVLDKTNFEEQIKLRWEFLQELQQTSTLSSVLEAQAKFTITQRTKRIQMYRNCQLPEIVSSLRHNPCLLDDELIKFVQNPSITDIITVDCTKRCTHDSSLHVFIVTSMKNEDVTMIDIPITIQSVRCYLEKYHSSSCDEVIFISQEDAAKYISEEGFHHRFHLRDDYLVGSVSVLYVWTSNCKQGRQTDTALLPDEESKCSTCFESSSEIPLSLEKFNVVEEWCKSVPIHVQLLLEAYINKDYARRCENKENYIKEKIKNLYQLHDSLLHFHNLRYIGIYQERNTEELVLNHKTLDTVFRITSESGTTVSLRLADQLIKKKAHIEICYYNTYLRRYSLEYQSSIGIKTGCLNIQDSILTIMLDNLVKLRYHDDPYPGESRSQQLCTLPITVKGIPPDSSIVDQWHNAEDCDGEITCQCKKTTPITKENYEEFFLELLPSEKARLQCFHQLYTWGFCGLWKHITASNKVSIGDVNIKVKTPKSPELVPTNYLSHETPQSVLRHLRWIMQKDLLGQDVFLIGAPGPLRRQVAMMYLELTKREAEYVSLSRDTTEADLKQRREIRDGSAFYLDQCAVRAAVNGHVLVLEGIEKAERNVLPILNNLLENREMQLEDGRFLVAANRYDKLLQDHTKEELDELKLVRVDETFRVIALGLPIPRYQGNPLDPPLRSRFQARDINPPPFAEQYESLYSSTSNIKSERLSQLLSFASTMITSESNSLGLPDFPITNLQDIVKIINEFPEANVSSLLKRLYPYETMLGKEGQSAVQDALSKFELTAAFGETYHLDSVEKLEENLARVLVTSGKKMHQFQVDAGSLEIKSTSDRGDFVQTKYHDAFLAEMVQSHMVKDFCVVGSRGCGKSTLVKRFAELLGYHIEPIMLYQDMTSRDLVQQRTTLPNGDTTWRLSPLVTAALDGSLAVLDGVHRINAGSFSVLHRLVHDRELQLFDGSRLMSKDKYDKIKQENNLTDQDMTDRHIHCIHPGFRIVALAEPPVVGSATNQWLSPEMLTMFLYHSMRPLTQAEELDVITQLVPNCPDLTKLMLFVHKLRQSSDPTISSLASSLSMRQLIRVARRLASFPSEDLYGVIQKACLARFVNCSAFPKFSVGFLPRLPKSALEQSLEESAIVKVEPATHTIDNIEKSVTCEIKNNKLRIGNTEVDVYNPENRTKVPDVLFYENTQHLSVMEDMLKDFLLGEHLLLVGNQGVGKNKIIDRFLHLLNRPREYIQLHRDTTVQTLTLQPTVQDGVIIYEDSPLVRAVKLGHVLVVDEADKAPTHVTCILKTLVESGEMHLADGRRIVPASSGLTPTPQRIVSHPDFRMCVLANRPGFPFLGNDFFGAMGDIFSCHAIDNPDKASEMSMLRQYGPDVPETTLEKLVLAFGELRDMADQGLIAYPYSTREVVNMVKHLQEYPNEGLTSVVRNVFDFDSYNKELRETLVTTMQKHGIPLGASPDSVQLAKELPLPNMELLGKWNIASQGSRQKTALMSLPVETKRFGIKGPITIRVETIPLDRTEARSNIFTEQQAFWEIPMHETNIICDLGVTKAAVRSPGHTSSDIIHIGTANPVCLYSMNPRTMTANFLDMYDIFPTTSGSYKPRIKIAPLASPLDDSVILHEEVTNIVLVVNIETGEVSRITCSTLPQTVPEKRRFPSVATAKSSPYRLCQMNAPDPYGTVIFYEQNGDFLEVLSVLEGISHTVSLPIHIHDVHQLATDKWILSEAKTNKKYLVERQSAAEFVLKPINEEGVDMRLQRLSMTPLSASMLSKSIGENISSPNRVAITPNQYGSILVGFPDLDTTDVYGIPREPLNDENPMDKSDQLIGNIVGGKSTSRSQVSSSVYLPECGQVVRTLPTWKVPDGVIARDQKPHVSGFLEVTDMANHKLRYIPVPGATKVSPYASWLFSISDSSLLLAGTSNDGLVTVDVGGRVRLWETGLVNLERSLGEWKNMIGWQDTKPLQVTYEKESSRTAEDLPKHGKEDPSGAPHVGGNTWAGGTGGTTTAGLGGFGGPYRLDAGHDVTQVPQWQKDSFPEHVRQAAREMAQKAFKERLREIQMSEYDAETYEKFSNSVRRQVQSLRVILDSLQAKGKERQWLKNQTYGDLDDAKLIDGLTGEKSVYKRRGEKEPEMGAQQELPKKLRLLVDVSGSMYRFNSYDGRLEREMETCIMAMEALEGYEDKIKYDIVGHSGEDYKVQLTEFDKPPKNNKERLNAGKIMHAHSQFCLSGDMTLQATKHAIETLAKEEADEHFLIVLSDANFDRYGISPARFGEILRGNEKVNAYAIFIGSLGDQAVRLTKQLPMGHSFVCMDTKNLPQILQQIFTSTMLSTK